MTTLLENVLACIYSNAFSRLCQYFVQHLQKFINNSKKALQRDKSAKSVPFYDETCANNSVLAQV
jgi:hypothetical protein